MCINVLSITHCSTASIVKKAPPPHLSRFRIEEPIKAQFSISTQLLRTVCLFERDGGRDIDISKHISQIGFLAITQ